MNKLYAFCLFLYVSLLNAQTWNTEEQYIQNFAIYAVEEMERYKIPASIKLAQGLLETGGGQSILAIQGRNHFGIKCKNDWKGKTMKYTDDAYNECFRVYDSPRDSYRDHSIFLSERKRYEPLFRLKSTDYKSWAHGLKRAGYATNPKYASLLIKKIEQHKLYLFDKTSSKKLQITLAKLYPDLNDDFTKKIIISDIKLAENNKILPKNNISYLSGKKTLDGKEIKSYNSGYVDPKILLRQLVIRQHPNRRLKFVVTPSTMDISQISEKYKISARKLMKYNDLTDSQVSKDKIIFLTAKRSSTFQETYITEAGDSMHDISQKFGLKLRKLYSRNRMSSGDQPIKGQKIYLNHRKPRK